MDRLKYAEQGKEKPGRGFNTSDYMRTDEFTMTFRTEQYRTLLKVRHSTAAVHCKVCKTSLQRFPKQRPANSPMLAADSLTMLPACNRSITIPRTGRVTLFVLV